MITYAMILLNRNTIKNALFLPTGSPVPLIVSPSVIK